MNYQLEKLEVENRHEHSSKRDLLVKIDQQVSIWQYPEKNLTELFSGFRRQLDDYESLDLSPAEKAQITDNLNKPDSTTCHGNDHQPNLDKFVTETLSARRSARTTRRGRRTWGRRSTLRPPWTWTPPRWADRTWSPSSLLRTWCPARDPLVTACNTRWDKFSNFTSGVGKFS